MERIKLFCLPYAGSSALIYLQWRKIFAPRIEIIPVELPGRGKRFFSPLLYDLHEAVEDLFQLIQRELIHSKYAIFGHSMGSWLAFELAHKIMDNGYDEPLHLFVSGRYPVHLPKSGPILHTLSDPEIRADLLRMGSKIQEVDCPEWWSMFMPVLRADYKILDTYQFTPKPRKLHCDITALAGVQDHLTNAEEMGLWQEHTSGKCRVHQFEGRHFFIHDRTAEVAERILAALACADQPLNQVL